MDTSKYTKKVVVISAESTLIEAAKLMKQKNVGCLVVIKDKKQDSAPVGMLTDRDIVIKCLADKKDASSTRVKDIMSENLLTIKKDQGIKEMMTLLAQEGVRRAPVVDENNKVCGLVAMDDMLTLIANELNSIKNVIEKQM